jgi:hypothetical protein
MKRQLIYVELKTGCADRGPAWIGFGEYSKSGRTIYFNDQGFQSCKGRGIGANFHDLESGDEYWISGIKREGGDRHWAGSGIISVDREAVSDYLAMRDFDELDPKRYKMFSPAAGDIRQRVRLLENQTSAPT